MEVSIGLIFGALLVFVLITAVGIYAGRKIRSATDFSVGKGMGTTVVAGSLVGTLVGGASTVGTAQLAFTNGLSAWWYTLGGGIGLFAMALFFASPLRNNGSMTMPGILTKEYGKRVATVAAVLMSVGTFISIMSQMISGVALITSVVPVCAVAAAAVTAVLMIFYVLFGGVWGAGLVGRVKTLLLYGLTILCAAVVLHLGGFETLLQLPKEQYFDLFSRGIVVDGGAGLSLLFGVMTTQAYFLPVISAKDLRTSRTGAILGGVLTVAIGMAGVLVGLFMRVHMPQTPSAMVLPVFVLTYLPDLAAGLILATVLVTLVGTGAGLSLGISTMLTMDIYVPLLHPGASGKEQLRFSRSVLLLILLLAAVLATGEAGSVILQWSFLSMGLRGAVAFVPVCFALFRPGSLPGKAAVAAMILAPVTCLFSFYFVKGIDPLFPGMAVSVLICIIGTAIKRSPFRSNR
ncbi:MAG: sodium:solute symporter family protein [Oscillospiraceae bacterium]|nr:sodium:solute symporter family protein [Oscillospiraceae bacterium]